MYTFGTLFALLFLTGIARSIHNHYHHNEYYYEGDNDCEADSMDCDCCDDTAELDFDGGDG